MVDGRAISSAFYRVENPSKDAGVPDRALLYANDDPTFSAKRCGYAPVSFLVGIEFCLPECGVGSRKIFALRASVPETAIDENGNLTPRPCKIGLSGDVPMFSVAPQSRCPKQSCEGNLSGCISSGTHRGHDLRTNCFADVVHDNSGNGIYQRAE
jgi:hypothetical protein